VILSHQKIEKIDTYFDNAILIVKRTKELALETKQLAIELKDLLVVLLILVLLLEHCIKILRG
jgi:DNA-directed RNA polymerase subunit K/omega